MTYSQLRDYLQRGGTNMQYVIEAIKENTTDDTARELIRKFFENLEDQ